MLIFREHYAHCPKVKVNCKDKYSVNVFAVSLENNEAKMMLFREFFYPEIPAYGFLAQNLNFVEQDVLSNIIGNVKHIHTFFRGHHRPFGWFKNNIKLRSQLLTDTRWNS